MIPENLYRLSDEAFSRILFHNTWIEFEGPRRGLRDSLMHSPHRPIHTEEVLTKIAGVEVSATKTVYNDCAEEELLAWETERDEYIRQRDEWIALQMFQKYGYETFLEDCRMYNLSETFIKQLRPCDSTGNPQCSLYCPFYETCERR